MNVKLLFSVVLIALCSTASAAAASVNLPDFFSAQAEKAAKQQLPPKPARKHIVLPTKQIWCASRQAAYHEATLGKKDTILPEGTPSCWQLSAPRMALFAPHASCVDMTDLAKRDMTPVDEGYTPVLPDLGCFYRGAFVGAKTDVYFRIDNGLDSLSDNFP